MTTLLLASVTSRSLQAQAFLIGGYADGIYASQIDSQGKMESPRKVVDQHLPSFLAIHPKKEIVYAVTETTKGDSKNPASVVSHRMKWENDGHTLSALDRFNEQTVDGDHPCYVSVDATGKLLAVANYSSGTLALYRLDEDGKILPHPQVLQHQGSGPNQQRQQAAHAHCAVFDPSNRWLVAADLGADRVFIYKIDHEHGKLEPGKHPSMAVQPGSGPRHVTFHPKGRFAFIINELALTLTSAEWNSNEGSLTEIESLSTVPPGIKTDGFSTAEVLVHPSGKFVYGSNRGHHSITAFAFDESTKRLSWVGNYPTGGKTPRNFRLTPDGKFLLAENQESDSIHSFAVNSDTGELVPTKASIAQRAPACIKFLPPRETR